MLIQVALPVPLDRLFDYRVPEGMSIPAIGARVSVPFSRQTLVGIVIAHLTQSSIAPTQLRDINAVIDEVALLETSMLNFAQWLADYYHYPLGDVFAVMLPTLICQGQILERQLPYWRQVRPLSEQDFTANANKQKQQFAIFTSLSNAAPSGINEASLLQAGLTRSYLQKFADKGLIECYMSSPKPPALATLATPALTLNLNQQQAVTAINEAVSQGHYQGFLLNGITGSGKTEVYLQAMQQVLSAGKQVLILVPEIGLTPQTKQRFAARFHAEVLMLHSGLSDRTRLEGWQACRSGNAQIIIGTRSAILYPFANLGLIIVDESHDQSYKQQDSLRYHATDVALYRGYQAQCPVVLGTATPSLESLHLVAQGKLTGLVLPERAGDASPAVVQLVDARQQQWQHGLALTVIEAMHQTLAKNEQVLVFLNRRGYAPILLCDACGWQADCPRCDAHLTVHHQPTTALKCHHCDWQQRIPSQCPNCGSTNLDPIGIGTARLVEGLKQLFPTTPIIQIDRDTTRRKESWETVYQMVNDHPAAILVGTQMVAKGHHFPNVTLVVIPNADRGFLSADFRSPEHTAQLITQVAGRAGRAEKPGQVLIQTLQPENPALLTLVRQGYMPLAHNLLAERQLLALPPFSYACLVRVESKSLSQNQQVLHEALQLLPTSAELIQQGIRTLGPVDAPMAKKNSRYHSQLLLLSQQRSPLHQLLNHWWPQVTALASAKYARLSLDIDPIGWS